MAVPWPACPARAGHGDARGDRAGPKQSPGTCVGLPYRGPAAMPRGRGQDHHPIKRRATPVGTIEPNGLLLRLKFRRTSQAAETGLHHGGGSALSVLPKICLGQGKMYYLKSGEGRRPVASRFWQSGYRGSWSLVSTSGRPSGI